MNELVDAIFKSYGLVGLILFLPLIALVVMWRAQLKQLSDHRKELETKDSIILDVQKQRVADAQAVTEKMVELVSEQSTLNKETNMVLTQMNNTLQRLT